MIPGRCGDATAGCRVCKRESVIFERNSTEVVLFALHSLRRAISPRNLIYLGFSMETRIVKFEMDPSKNMTLCDRYFFDVGGARAQLVPPRASRRSWFVRRIVLIETRAVWRCRGRLTGLQTPKWHFRTDIHRAGPVCFSRPYLAQSTATCLYA